MSVSYVKRSHQRDKTIREATADERRIAELTKVNDDTDSLLVAQLMEITGATEDIARTALFDTNNDCNMAAELILEQGCETNAWETAGRKRGKTVAAKVHHNEDRSGGDDDAKNGMRGFHSYDKSDFRGRGRGRKSSRGRNNYDRRNNETNSRDYTESRERRYNGRREGGRGRGRASGRGAHQSNRGVSRRFNRGRGSTNADRAQSNHFEEGFEPPAGSDDITKSQEPIWGEEEEEDWGASAKMEAGWVNEDGRNKEFDDWGANPWSAPIRKLLGNDALTETKQVFQEKSQSVAEAPSSSSVQAAAAEPVASNDVGAVQKRTAPQSGERIDIGSLFKKNVSRTNMYGSGMVKAESNEIQSSSLFSDGQKPSTETSRLFSSYEQPAAAETPPVAAASTQSAATSTAMPPSPAASAADHMMAAADINKENAAAERFTEYSGMDLVSSSQTTTMKEQQTGKDSVTLMPHLKNSCTPQRKQAESEPASLAAASGGNFSEAQQKEATDAVKASLGLMPASNSGEVPKAAPMRQSTCDLEFGYSKTEKRKDKEKRVLPPSIEQSKIPAAVVEMPKNSILGKQPNSYPELEFGIGAHLLASGKLDFVHSSEMFGESVADESSVSASANMPETIFQSSLANKQTPPSNPTSSILSSSNLEASVTDVATQQRFSDTSKPTEQLRGPPGLSHPQVSSSAAVAASMISTLPNTNPNQSLPNSAQFSSPAAPGYPSMQAINGLVSEIPNSQPTSLPTQFYGNSLEHSPAGQGLRSPAPSASNHSGKLQPSTQSMLMKNSPASMDMLNQSGDMSTLNQSLAQAHISPSATQQQSSTSAAGSENTGSEQSTTFGANFSQSSTINTSQQPKPQVSQPSMAEQMAGLYASSSGAAAPTSTNQQSSSNTDSPSTLQQQQQQQSVPPSSQAVKSTMSSASKAVPPNLSLNTVPQMLHSQFSMHMPGPAGLMTAYAPQPEATMYPFDQIMAVQQRVQMPTNYYDHLQSFSNNSNPNAAAVGGNNNRGENASGSAVNHGKFNRGEPSSPQSSLMFGSPLTQQQAAPAANQHSSSIKVTQAAPTHQQAAAQHLVTGFPPHHYPGYPHGQFIYPNFQYGTMFAAAPTTQVPQNAKHGANVTTAFQPHPAGYGNAYSSTTSANAPSSNSLHELNAAGFTKNPMTLAAAAGANNNAGPAGGAPGMSPFAQGHFMHMFQPAHGQPTAPASQVQLVHQDLNQSVGSHRSQAANSLGKNASKTPFGNAPAPYGWGS